MTNQDAWTLTYEDSTDAPTDERLTYELLCGGDVRLPNGRLGRKYLKPGSEREQAARAALARLIRKGSPFPGFIRETLAALFDPASATVPAGRRIDFIDQKQNRPKEGFDVALHVWFRWKLGDKKESLRQKGPQVCREFRDDEGVIEMTKMRWHLVKLHGRPSLDFRREFEFEDRAAKWLRVVQANRLQQRSRPRARRSFSSTQPSSI